MPLATTQALKAHAEAVARDQDGAEYLELSSLMCWSATIRCALNAGAITAVRAQRLESLDWAEDFSPFVSRGDTRVRTPAEMRLVPAGAFIAFIRVDPPDAYFRFVHDMRGKRHIVHAMLSLGNGWAAGNKNSCVGIGHHVGWEVLNLADGLNWINGRYDAINGYPRNASASMPLRIRYRELAKFQDDAPPSAPGRPGQPTSSGKIRNLGTGQTVVVRPGETWDVGPLADCVALAAIKPPHALTTKRATSIFLWHINGGLVQRDTIPYNALTAFLGGRNADWVFVHGKSAGRQGPSSFQNQDFVEELVDGLNTIIPGHLVQSYLGSSLLIDAKGSILNVDDLKALRP